MLYFSEKIKTGWLALGRKKGPLVYVLGGLLLLFIFFQLPVFNPRPAAAGEPYNIVLIYTDDQRWDTVCGPDGLAEICSLPKRFHPLAFVERQIMDRGVVFSNAFVSNPVCCPSRASLLSGGFYSHNTNVLSNRLPNGGVTQFSDADTLATRLQASGYQTGMVGKYLNQYNSLADVSAGEGYVPPGWTRFWAQFRIYDWLNNFDIVVGDKIMMLEYSTYSVISPEGCASILWKSADKAEEAAEAMGITAKRLKELGLIDHIIREPLGSAHRDIDAAARNIINAMIWSTRLLIF